VMSDETPKKIGTIIGKRLQEERQTS